MGKSVETGEQVVNKEMKHSKRVFRTQSNICNGAVLRKQLALTIFEKKLHRRCLIGSKTPLRSN